MKLTKRHLVTVIGFVLSSLLLVVAASCSFEERTAEGPGRQAAEDVSVEPSVAEESVAQQVADRPVGQQTKDEPAQKDAVQETFIANPFCAACHYAFDEEELAVTHARAGIGCERCHGESERHRSDEDNVTPPEIMYPKEKIIPTCMMCHPRHEIHHVKAHESLLAGAETIFDPQIDAAENNGADKTYCTTCHAKEHRINVRTIRWNKATGELLDE